MKVVNDWIKKNELGVASQFVVRTGASEHDTVKLIADNPVNAELIFDGLQESVLELAV